MKRGVSVKSVAALFLVASGAFAQAPMLLNYQGRLTDPSGNPRNGTFMMVRMSLVPALPSARGLRVPGTARSPSR